MHERASVPNQWRDVESDNRQYRHCQQHAAGHQKGINESAPTAQPCQRVECQKQDQSDAKIHQPIAIDLKGQKRTETPCGEKLDPQQSDDPDAHVAHEMSQMHDRHGMRKILRRGGLKCMLRAAAH